MITGFLLKRPDKTRRTFQIIPYRRANGKKLYTTPVEMTELDALNESLRRGTITAAQAEVEIKAKIIPELKRRAKVPVKATIDAMVSEHNLNVFNEFWNKEYRRSKLERPKTAKDEFHTALKLLEPLSLHSCDVDELQDHWDKKLKGTRHKRYGNRINQLLKFLKRGFEIVTERAEQVPLRWVSWEDLEKILEKIEDESLCDLYRTLYGTGARLGEVFLITPEDIRSNGTIFIHQQVTPDRKIKNYTKNKKAHDTIILPEALEAAKRWAAIEDKIPIRSRCQHPLIDAAKATFRGNPTKQISPHKLRHSYVKKMMILGVPIDRIAQFLGDRVSTVESTYRQWTVTDSEIDYVKGIMDAGYKSLKKQK